MKTVLLSVVMTGLVVAATGCAYNSIMGNGIVRADQYFGDVGLTGDNHNVTIVRGSRVNKLSILGDDCSVTVQNGVALCKIEFWGTGNTISLPEGLLVRTTEVGMNQIIRRPRRAREPGRWTDVDTVLQTETPEPVPWTEPAPETSTPEPSTEAEDWPASPEEGDMDYPPPPPIEIETTK